MSEAELNPSSALASQAAGSKVPHTTRVSPLMFAASQAADDTPKHGKGCHDAQDPAGG